MINIYVDRRGDTVEFKFDGGILVKKTLKITGCALAVLPESSHKLELSYLLVKKCREAIRDWLFIIHGNDWRKKERTFSPLFRVVM